MYKTIITTLLVTLTGATVASAMYAGQSINEMEEKKMTDKKENGIIRGIDPGVINNLDDYIILTGMQKNPYPYLGASDIYVQPSYEEALSIAMLEAQRRLLHGSATYWFFSGTAS